MANWKQLRDLKLSAITDAADGWGEVSDRASAAMDRVDREMSAKMQSQKGEGSEKAKARLIRLSRNFQYIKTECGLIQTTFNGLAEQLREPQRKLKSALEDAKGLKFTVLDDGSVEYPGSFLPIGEENNNAPRVPAPTAPDAPNAANRSKAQDIADRIAKAVSDANDIDLKYYRLLNKLKTKRGLKIDAKILANMKYDIKSVRRGTGDIFKRSEIPKGKTPKENAEWWKSLSPDEKDELTSLYPASIGALDGLPTDVRDDANRVVLSTTKAELQLERDKLQSELDSTYLIRGKLPKRMQIKDIEKDLKGLQQVQDRLYAGPTADAPAAYLLGIDTDKAGHAIVSVGNPDTADNVATYVPGMGTNLETIGKDIARADVLHNETAKTSYSDTTASIMWLDYDSPQGVKDASNAQRADRGTDDLESFLYGLDAAHKGESANNTLLGHSYGSLVSGKTLAGDSQIPIDNVIFVGSPGTGVDKASELGVPPENVWAGAAKNDPVTKMGYFGTTPHSPEFGGQRFDVASGSHWPPFSAHSIYWDENSKSLAAMADIVTVGEPQ